jgi:hypothetical protein
MSTFTPFSRLPMELRDLVWQASKPTTATVEFDEDEYQVTSISPPSALLTTSKEARATALSFSLSLSLAKKSPSGAQKTGRIWP